MPTKNVNTNINNIKIEIPKQKQYRPRQKSVSQAEEELQKLENADANYRMGNPINVSVVQPPTINPSVFGFTNIPVQREITETSKGEAISKPVEVPPVEVPPVEAPPMEEAPVEEPTKKRGGRPRGSKNAPKVAVGVPTNQSLVTDYLGAKSKGYDSGYESGYYPESARRYSPQLAALKERSDFASKNKEAAKSSGYVQSALDLELQRKQEEESKKPKPTKFVVVKPRKTEEEKAQRREQKKMAEEEKAQKKVEKEQKKEEVKKTKTGLRGGPTMAED